MSQASNNDDFESHPALPLSDLFGDFDVAKCVVAYATDNNPPKDVDSSQQHHESPRRPQSTDRKLDDEVVATPLKALQSFNASAEQFVRKQREEEVPLEPFVSNPFLLNVCQLRSLLNQLADKKE